MYNLYFDINYSLLNDATDQLALARVCFVVLVDTNTDISVSENKYRSLAKLVSVMY
jgi:hypothetical protein